ncbi:MULTISPECIES: universal stress protein [Brachybacterium]|uniref:Universal stress protein n=2 Tax=Brachybacterium TaxID=43668 RepID=A0A3R8QT60_9MICO|nr:MULTISPECIES: universal stress protein [Brachybacterium]MCT1438672.1 universal stress protein [Brachybacterium paraconglomeratum]RRR17319.1 universal stress protein [Brachybacterium paraconglomeratum]GLI31564.1 universal stress protein UspA [Brachybacterium conglomeratum]GLK04476.1 universal stress protein UspA [Brachybacterium conglomeratum]
MTIVVGYAPSTQGRAALRAGIRYAERTGSPLLVAAHQHAVPGSGGAAATEEEVRAELEEQGADLEGVTIRRGPDREIGEFLLATIEDVQAELVVIGLRRKSPIGKLNLGASARRVVLGAPCPVLTVKDQDPA